MDAVPGKLTTLWFKATVPGTYHLFCAEYCGTKHSGMIGQVIVMAPQDYEAWLAGGTGGPAVPPAQAGEKLFTGPNSAARPATSATAPGPRAVAARACSAARCSWPTGGRCMADDNYLRESIMVSAAKVVKGIQPVMPPFQGLDQRGTADAAHRVRQDAQAGGRRRRRPVGERVRL